MSRQRSQIEAIIDRFIATLKEQGISTDKVILFGSYAKGTANQFSDIDIIVISKSFEGMSFEQRCAVLGKAIAKIMEPVEPIAYTPEEIERLSSLSFVGSIVKAKGQIVELNYSQL